MPRTIILRAVSLLAVFAAGAAAQNEHVPLFSVRNGGPSGLEGRAVYQTIGGVPVQIGGAEGMSLFDPADDIISLAPVVVPTLRATKDFVICFSVDPFSTGKNRGRITLQNLLRQALNNQQAGDAYLSTEAIRRGVGVLPPPFSMGLNNNALAVNQSQHYPNAFGLLPEADPGIQLPPGTPLDDVDATMGFTPDSPPRLFFTLETTSPSHLILPGPDSGATIFYDDHFLTPGNEDVYAGPEQLGLKLEDRITGMIVLDDNLNHVYDNTDTVYLTLGTNSRTLIDNNWQPGDLLVSEQGQIALFVEGTVFGLELGDNMNALDMVPLINDSAEDTINAMVDCPSDYNDDTIINTLDVLAFLNGWNAGDPRADFDGDGAFTTLDVLIFLNAWAGGC